MTPLLGIGLVFLLATLFLVLFTRRIDNDVSPATRGNPPGTGTLRTRRRRNRRLRAAFLLAVLAISGCTHPNGARYTVKEIYKLSRDFAIAACAAVDGPLGSAITVTIPEYGPIAVAAARGACVLVRLTPDVEFVVVDADGHGNAVSRAPTSSGGEQ